MRDLCNLPPELRLLIFSFLSKRTNLVNLTLTCKDFYNIVVHRLFHDCEFHVSRGLALAAGAFIPEGQGHKHIRHVTVIAEEEHLYRHGLNHSELEAFIQLLASLIPKDTLETLTYVC